MDEVCPGGAGLNPSHVDMKFTAETAREMIYIVCRLRSQAHIVVLKDARFVSF